MLGERPPPTAFVPAKEAADAQVHHHLSPTDRLVRDAACVATVNAARATSAVRASGCVGHPAGFYVHDAIQDERALDTETDQLGKELWNAQMNTSGAAAPR